MTKLVRRKTRLVLETPLNVERRPLVVTVEAAGLSLRPKGRRHALGISWAQVWNRAAWIAADAEREARKLRRRRAADHA